MSDSTIRTPIDDIKIQCDRLLRDTGLTDGYLQVKVLIEIAIQLKRIADSGVRVHEGLESLVRWGKR